ncbi:uncharacterized protein L969DRAFT_70064 [Mixia osmundae IAM 14324]|uniref:Uncharacterized protein n=1 Tax=Mixia osmundae (strain CBS 9802 / IAM 14324 / JCM 22182 / KY 12970) TaxID=764103 RepID=G7DT53_MIXOS|nr:uncharacterized protein L969DRAFT_70064 [Mixia osmundae IAM 14324]KEI42734.1 hypothetical protein L969DRAFT_70064 [Mixia osmundae IAM 14324]GAA93932.1 hypothetical protein E5Q_00578 [Mixia osmundae IAM 14324]
MFLCHKYAGPSCEFPPRKTWRQTVERGQPVTTVPTQRSHDLSGDIYQLGKDTSELLSTIWRATWRYSQPFSASSAVRSSPTTRNTLLPGKFMSRFRFGTGGEIPLGEEFPDRGLCGQRLVSVYLANTARERGLHLFCLAPPLLDRPMGTCSTRLDSDFNGHCEPMRISDSSWQPWLPCNLIKQQATDGQGITMRRSLLTREPPRTVSVGHVHTSHC